MANDSVIDVIDILNEYSANIQEAIVEEAQKVAKEGASELKNTSPKRTGKYRKGWRVKTTKSKGSVECIIYNSTNWQLTHLLEKSHAKRNGGVTSPIVHIKPVEERCIKRFEKDVESIIKNGG